MASPLRSGEDTFVSQRPTSLQDAGVSELLKNLVSEAAELVRSEANVMKLEVQESTQAMIVDAVKSAVFGGVALLGVLSLMAFLIIAIGELIGGGSATGYWVSALGIGLVFTIVGGAMAAYYGRRIGESAGLPKTRSEIRTDESLVRREVAKIREAGHL